MNPIVELKIGIATTTVEIDPEKQDWLQVVDLLIQINAYAGSKAPSFAPTGPEQKPAQPAGIATDEFPITSFEITENNGVKAVRVRGGAWTKFGVPLYSDSCRLPDDVRALLTTVPFGELTPHRPLTAIALMRGGKPAKVTEIV